MVSTLHRKLLRDLWQLRGQVLTIAMVVACGIAAYVLMHSTWRSLIYTRDAYYDRYRMADVFAQVERAPLLLGEQLQQVPGVSSLYLRVVKPVVLPLADRAEPATGRLISVPTDGDPPLCGLFLRRGRQLDPERSDEVLVNEAFSDANNVQTGDTLPAVINGIRRELHVVGIALSPEYVFAVGGGDITADNKRFAVLWMNERHVRAAFRMEGSFNDVVVRLAPGAKEVAVLSAIDGLLKPFGSTGSVGRDKQVSNRMLQGELEQLRSYTTSVPAIFLLVAAFLVHVVLSRVVQIQRTQIATLKAIGYSDWQVGSHYIELVSLIVILGALGGVAIGAWMGRGLTEMYQEFFRFPLLSYRVDAQVIVISVGISVGSAIFGAYFTARQVAKLPPAEAMQPPPPPRYRRSLIEKMGLSRVLGPSVMMIVRELSRRPMRAALSSLGIGAAIAILITGMFLFDAIELFIGDMFQRAQRQDLTVGLVKPGPRRAVADVAHLPGVFHAEGLRYVPVRFRYGPRRREGALVGMPEQMSMQIILSHPPVEVHVPKEGLLLTRKLAELLDLSVGDSVEVEVMEGQRPTLQVRVTQLVDELMGMQGYLEADALTRLVGGEPQVTTILCRIDASAFDDITRRLKNMPNIGQVIRRTEVISNFRGQTEKSMRLMTLFLTLFAGAIALGVVYNNARVALSVRSRELASLRVLGMTRGEVSSILLGELGLQMALAIPLGLWLGRKLAELTAEMSDPELFRIPVVISQWTQGFAVTVTLLAGTLSALLVRRQVDQLDLIAVLKTRE